MILRALVLRNSSAHHQLGDLGEQTQLRIPPVPLMKARHAGGAGSGGAAKLDFRKGKMVAPPAAHGQFLDQRWHLLPRQPLLHLIEIKVSWLQFQEGSKRKNCGELNNTANWFNYST